MNKIYLPTLIAIICIVLLFVLLILAPMLMLKPMQTTDLVAMVRPRDFAYNPQTATTNHYMHPAEKTAANNEIRKKATTEFNDMVNALLKNTVRVMVFDQPRDILTPDAVFPNNWFSTFKDRYSQVNLVIYPMLNQSRRLEKSIDALTNNLKIQGVEIHKEWDFSNLEQTHQALEGTGSVVFDHAERLGYVSLSPRSDKAAAETILKQIGFQPIFFQSFDEGIPIYHTNLVLSIGNKFAVLCDECIPFQVELRNVIHELENSNKDIIKISAEQMRHMCGNILEIRSTYQEPKIVMSTTAFKNFTEQQKKRLQQYGDFIVVDIPTIEHIGGGSARCMMAEIFH